MTRKINHFGDLVEHVFADLKPSQKCKQAGLKSLAELAQITGRPERTLTEWARTDPDWFDLVLAGAVSVRLCRLRGRDE